MLYEKGVEFELIEVDLSDKPKWFVKVSPYTKVPVLKKNALVIWESTVINEYIDETYTAPAMIPDDAGHRALARIWVDYCNTRFVSAFGGLLRENDSSVWPEKRETLLKILRYIEKEGLAKLGANPYWMGDGISIVDVAFWPWFERFDALTHYRNISIPDDCVHLKEWVKAMLMRPSVQRAQNPVEYFISAYSRYAGAKQG